MRFLLYPISVFYGFVIWIRNFLFDYNILHSKEYDIPVICVGNISVGGTGKTPHVEYLVDALKDKMKIAVLSRGYKRKTRGFIEVETNMGVNEVGDEPLQIKTKFPEITVAVDRSRVHGIDTIISEKVNTKIDVIILDDAFQHRYVNPGLSVLLVDYNRLITKDNLLPYGRLREPAYQKKRAHIILVTKCPDKLSPIEQRILFKEFNTFPYQNLYFTSLNYLELKQLFTKEIIKTDSDNLKSFSVMLITGIANADPLVEFLKPLCKEIIHLNFPDHYNFKEKDIEKLIRKFESVDNNAKIIVTTEKDSIRLKQKKFKMLIKDIPIYYIPILVRFLNNDADNFIKHIEQYAMSNKRKNK